MAFSLASIDLINKHVMTIVGTFIFDEIMAQINSPDRWVIIGDHRYC